MRILGSPLHSCIRYGYMVITRERTQYGLTVAGFLAPFLIVFGLFKIYPIFAGFVLSLMKAQIFGLSNTFVGLRNYARLLQDPVFWVSLKNTILYATLTTPIMIPIAITIALFLNLRVRVFELFRSLFFLPKILSVSVVGLLWMWIYQPDWGLLNFYLGRLGLPLQNWLQRPFMALFSIVIIDTWWTVGYQAIILLAGLSQIPGVLFEAADIEGATPLQKVFQIILPNLKQSILFVLVTHIIGCLQIFGLIFVVTEGGPYGSTRVMVQYIYENAFYYNKMGYASALAFVLMLVILVLTLIQFRVFKDE